jgi:glycosyltransferase involved in cell wall biosynthesis
MRELDYLLNAAARISECLFLFTGGQPHVIEELTRQLSERGISNVRFAGMLKEPEETRFYQQAADVLVTYYSTRDHPYAHHNLPGKVPEYMVTGNPIVSADFPAVRDLLNPGNAILVEPDDGEALVGALFRAVREGERSAALGAQAQRDVATRTTESLGSELGKFLVGAAQR